MVEHPYRQPLIMDYRRLGNSGLKVARLCLGTMQFGWSADEDTSLCIMDAYVEAGGNFIDTADGYSSWYKNNKGGEAETIVGNWLKERRNRYLIVVATKFNGRLWGGPNVDGLSRGHVMKAVEDSLRRLGTDYIDLYQTHWPHYDTPQEETLRALDDLVKAGKVRYIGCSNEPAWRLTKALWISERGNLNRFISLQPPYSMVRRADFERESEPLYLDQGIGVITYSPLQGGFLTGKYRPLLMDSKATGGAAAVGHPHAYFTADNKHVIYNANPMMIGHVWAARIPEGFLESLA